MGLGMSKFTKIVIGVLTMMLAVGASVLAQVATVTNAASTLQGNDEIITVSATATTDGQPLNSTMVPVGYSADGNTIVFLSQATNLPEAGGRGVYTLNVKTGAVARVDLSTDGIIPDRNASYVQVSETGRYITFSSDATNLVSTPHNPYSSIYLRDMQQGTTTLVDSGNVYQSNNNNERNLGVSNDGRFVLAASRYIVNSYPYYYGIILKDNSVTSGSSWTSLGVGTGIENSWSSTAVRGSLSCDGSFVLYQKTNNIELADLRKGSSAIVTNAIPSGLSPIISCNGRYILYATTDRTLITPTPAGMTSDKYHLVRYDRITGERMYIDSNSSGVFSSGYTWSSLSEPAENIFKASVADTGDVVFTYNGNVYLKHLSDGSGTLEPIAKMASGTYVNMQNGTITRDGKYIFYRADPYDLGLSPSSMGLQLIRARTNL
jgi:hypothetical protein